MFLRVRDVEMERRSGVNNSFKRRIKLNRLVKGTIFCDVVDNAEIKLRLRCVRITGANLVGFSLGSYRRHDGMTNFR